MGYTKIEGMRVEKERLISGRYLLQRPLARGQFCTVYKGFDQVLQRAVAVKVVPASSIAPYREAATLTAGFSHPNITGVYDMVTDAEMLYVIQEYIEGESFNTLIQTQLSPYHIADVGAQLCQALYYAYMREVCHGDLTPFAILRDQRGLVRINNFALPSDRAYFTAWSVVGSGGVVLSDPELPWGKVSDGRCEDDVRAVGLLLYQLLAGRAPGANSVEPPSDGRLRFLRSAPVELCEIIARAIVRQHPQHLTSVQPLHEALLQFMETIEPSDGISTYYQTEDIIQLQQTPPPNTSLAGVDRMVTSLPSRDGGQAGLLGSRSEGTANAGYTPPGVPPAPLISAGIAAATSADPTVRLVSTQDAYAPQPVQAMASSTPSYQIYSEEQRSRRLSLPLLIALGVLLFVLFFVAGYFIAHTMFP
jgi:serine/threonine protein kinase